MNKNKISVVIIEDGAKSGDDLKAIVEGINKNIIVIKILHSVAESVTWLLDHDMPHLILSGIKLGDGLSFDIFRKIPVTVPLIFYADSSQYALQAFESGAVDYLIKPVNEGKLVKSWEKMRMLKDFFANSSSQYNYQVAEQPLTPGKYASSLLVYSGIKIIPIAVDQILYIESNKTVTFLKTANGKFEIKRSLDSLAKDLDPQNFYRANRQYIIARLSVSGARHINARKLEVIFSIASVPQVIVSKAKATAFLKWLKNNN